MRLSLTTHAAIGTAPGVSPQPATAGSCSRLRACCRCPNAHVVFTVPEQLAPLALSNQRLFYNLLAPISNKFYKRFLRGSSTKEIGADSDHDRTSVLSFTITPDGKISALHLDESSRDSGLDRAAWQSTTQAKTFPPLPKDFHGASLSLRVRYSGARMPAKAS